MRRRGICSAGCWTLDRVKLVDRWPQEEALATIESVVRQGGGSAYNLGVDMRKLDPEIPVFAIGLIGADADGDYLFQQAAQHGINVDQLQRTTAAETSYTDVMSVVATGKRTFFHHAGTNDLLTPEHFDFSSSTAKILHLGLLGLHRRLDSAWKSEANGWVSVLKKARAAGLSTNVELVSIEPSQIRTLCEPCLPYLDRLIVNDHEIGGLAGVTTVHNGHTDVDACLLAARKVLERGAMELVVVHYPGGAIAIDAGETWLEPSFVIDAADIVGAVGAGDAFAAGVLYGWHELWTTKDTLKLGHAVAAASLRSATSVGSVVSVDECLALVGLQRSSSDSADVGDAHLQAIPST